jgi:myo-inositol catabolism protein IolH
MKIALDPYMLRRVPLNELPGVVADLGYEYIELSPREDFIPFFKHPRVDTAGIQAFRRALDGAGVKVSSLLPLFRWSGPDEDERAAAVRYWTRSIEIAAELGVAQMNSEFNGRPENPSISEAQFWRSLEELLPIFERYGVSLAVEPHPDDFIEDGLEAVQMVKGINHPNVSFLYCAPHTFHQGGNMAEIMRAAGDRLTMLHVADCFDHRASSGLRYITNPPGNSVRVHQHLDIGQGEVPWDTFFSTLEELRFDGIMTVCVFAWEDRAEASCRHNLAEIQRRTAAWSHLR